MPKRPHTPTITTSDSPHTPQNNANKRHEWQTPHRSAAICIIDFLEWKGKFDEIALLRGSIISREVNEDKYCPIR